MGNSVNVLALDPSFTCTGWAMRQFSGKVECGAKSFLLNTKEMKAWPARRFSQFTFWLEWMVRDLKVEVIVFEECTPGMASRDRDALVGIKTRILEVAAMHSIPTLTIYPSTLKKHATQNGFAKKEDMKAEAERQYAFYDPTEDPGGDMADALMLLSWFEAGAPLPEKKVRSKPKRKQ